MIKPSLSSRVSKVNEELQKLASIMADNTKIYFKAKQALQQINHQSFSSDSEEYEAPLFEFSEANGFSQKKSRIMSSGNEMESMTISGITKSATKSMIKQQLLENCSESVVRNSPVIFTDMTIKKFKSPSRRQESKKKLKQSIEKGGKVQHKQKSKIDGIKSRQKTSSKLKSAKSQNKIHHYISTINLNSDLKKTKKKATPSFNHPVQVKNLKKSSIPQSSKKFEYNSRLHPLSISMFPQTSSKLHTHDKTEQTDKHYAKETSKPLSNIHQKFQLNLKKQITMKISDLNIQKQLCQKQSEYLKAAMRFSEEKLRQICERLKNNVSEQILIKGFIMKTLVKFLIQFFIPSEFSHIDVDNYDEITLEELIRILTNTHFLKYMLKLPTILNQNNTLCEKNCVQLFEEKRFIQRKLSSLRPLQNDIIVIYFNSLYDYISFLLNNNMVHETKRRQIPFQFQSERSCKELPKLQTLLQKSHHFKQYDSQRKKQTKNSKNALKRVKTLKVLIKNKSAPKLKGKVKKNLHEKI